MDIGDHAADVALRIRTAVLPCLPLTSVDIGADLLIILEEIAMVHRVDLPHLGTFDIRMAEGKLADGWIQRKAIDAAAGGIDHHGRRTIDDISRGDLVTAGLEEIGLRTRTAFLADPAVDAEDR